MLPKNRRIEKKYFGKITKFGKRYNSDLFSLYKLPISDKDTRVPSKFSFSVSKKVSKLAVDRNKLRRRGYSVVSKHIKSITPGFFYYFSFKKLENNGFLTIEKDLMRLLS